MPVVNAPASETVYNGNGTKTVTTGGQGTTTADNTPGTINNPKAPSQAQIPVGISPQNPTGLAPYTPPPDTPGNQPAPGGPTPLVVPPSSSPIQPPSSDTIANYDAMSGGATNPITSTSGTARDDEANLGSQIGTMSDPNYQSTPNYAMSYLDSFGSTLDANYSAQQNEINANADNAENTQTAQDTADRGAESASLARSGGYLGPSASGNGVMLGLVATQRTQMQALEAARQKALADAATAYQASNFSLAQAKVAEAQKYEDDAYTQHQQFLAQTAAVQQTQTDQANEGLISGIMSKGLTDPNAIFQALNGAVPIATIQNFIKSATPESTGSPFDFTSADTAKLLGAGLTTSDIANVNAYVSQNGYTDQFRASLTPAERSVLDGIYRPKAAGAASGSGTGTSVKFTSTQLAKGAANAGMSIDDFKAMSQDDQNQFINSYAAFKTQQTAISKGTTTAAAVWSQINSSNLSANVKAIYAKKLGIDPNAPAGAGQSGSNFFKELENWAGDAWKTITGA